MIKRTVEISTGPAYLSVRNGQLVIRQGETEVGRVPCEDLGVLIVDTPACTYSQAVMAEAMRHGGVVVVCGADHLPAGVMLPMAGGSLQSERLRGQVEAKRPLGKRLWQQIVRCKIAGQAWVVSDNPDVARRLLGLRERVRSGDPENVEAQAARAYWPVVFGDAGFRRRREGRPPNNLLNYGYMVLRAAMARAICGAGLHPSIGFHHRNRYNAFCLADDLVEAYRPFLDARVREVWGEGLGDLERAVRARLLEVLAQGVRVGAESGPLMVGMGKTVASLCRCYEGQDEGLELPEP